MKNMKALDEACDCTCYFDKCKKLTTLQLLANAQALNTA